MSRLCLLPLIVFLAAGVRAERLPAETCPGVVLASGESILETGERLSWVRVDLRAAYGGGRSTCPFSPAHPERASAWRIREESARSSEDPERSPQRVVWDTRQHIAMVYFDPPTAGLQNRDVVNVGVEAEEGTETGSGRTVRLYAAQPVPVVFTQPRSFFPRIGLRPRNAELNDGEHAAVMQFPVRWTVPLVRRRGWGRYQFSTDDVLSTRSEDRSASIRVDAGWQHWGRHILGFPSGNYAQMSAGIGLLSNQSGSDTAGYAHLDGAWDIPFIPTRAAGGLLVSSLHPTLLVGAQYKQRFQRDLSLSPYHARKTVAQGLLGLRWTPVYLWPRRHTAIPSLRPTRHPFLEFSGNLWWLPNEEAVPGFRARKLERRFDGGLVLPISWWRHSAFTVSYHTGANEASGFARSSDWSFGVRLLGVRVLER